MKDPSEIEKMWLEYLENDWIIILLHNQEVFEWLTYFEQMVYTPKDFGGHGENKYFHTCLCFTNQKQILYVAFGKKTRKLFDFIKNSDSQLTEKEFKMLTTIEFVQDIRGKGVLMNSKFLKELDESKRRSKLKGYVNALIESLDIYIG